MASSALVFWDNFHQQGPKANNKCLRQRLWFGDGLTGTGRSLWYLWESLTEKGTEMRINRCVLEAGIYRSMTGWGVFWGVWSSSWNSDQFKKCHGFVLHAVTAGTNARQTNLRCSRLQTHAVFPGIRGHINTWTALLVKGRLKLLSSLKCSEASLKELSAPGCCPKLLPRSVTECL